MEAWPPDAASAERWLNGLERYGMRFGLERMRRLCAELGWPQRRYVTLHIVGTNGKTSVARLVEALLIDAGLRAGAGVSPHLSRWRERITIGGRRPAEAAFAAAAARVREAVTAIEAGERPATEERLTQFEIATAIAFVALAEAGVEVAAIEAGLGGRLDATNLLDSRLTVLTTVGLDHVELLGRGERQIAAEKLAVLRPGGALVLGPVSDPVRELARRRATAQGARLIEPHDGSAAPLPGPPGFRRTDLELARAAAIYLLDSMGRGRAADRLRDDPEHVARLAARTVIPGRLELIEGDPPLLLDVAHNPQGAAALAAAVAEPAGGRPLVACLAVLADKDLDGIVAALAPAVERLVCTELPAKLLGGGRPGARSHSAGRLAASARRHGKAAEEQPDPDQAIGRAEEWAAEHGGVALVAGSHHLVGRARDRRLCHH